MPNHHDPEVERYALQMILSGAESLIEDDLNEGGELTDEQHTRACEFGHALIKAVRDEQSLLLRRAHDYLSAQGEPDDRPKENE